MPMKGSSPEIESENATLRIVIPAKAGIQLHFAVGLKLDPDFRRGAECRRRWPGLRTAMTKEAPDRPAHLPPENRWSTLRIVIPAKAGIQLHFAVGLKLDPDFRRGDECGEM